MRCEGRDAECRVVVRWVTGGSAHVAQVIERVKRSYEIEARENRVERDEQFVSRRLSVDAASRRGHSPARGQ